MAETPETAETSRMRQTVAYIRSAPGNFLKGIADGFGKLAMGVLAEPLVSFARESASTAESTVHAGWHCAIDAIKNTLTFRPVDAIGNVVVGFDRVAEGLTGVAKHAVHAGFSALDASRAATCTVAFALIGASYEKDVQASTDVARTVTLRGPYLPAKKPDSQQAPKA